VASRVLNSLLPPSLPEVERSVCNRCPDRRCIIGLKTAILGENKKEGWRAKEYYFLEWL